MTTWTTVFAKNTPDGLMEFQGPKIKASTIEKAKEKALELNVTLSDKYIKPPLYVRIKMLFKRALS